MKVIPNVAQRIAPRRAAVVQQRRDLSQCACKRHNSNKKACATVVRNNSPYVAQCIAPRRTEVTQQRRDLLQCIWHSSGTGCARVLNSVEEHLIKALMLRSAARHRQK
jgi:hypothetical protein